MLSVAKTSDMPLVAPLVGRPVTFERTVITPEQAMVILENHNPNNRTIARNTVEAYAREMRAGRWGLSNDAMAFDVDGNLLNGQHRLTACILADVPIPVAIMRNVPREDQDRMDLGRPRHIADILHMKGYKYSHRLSGALRAMWNMKDLTNWTRKVAPGELLAIAERHPKLIESVIASEEVKAFPRNGVTAVHYVATHLLNEPEKANAFMGVFATGVPTYPGDPAHVLRENYLAARRHAAMAARFSHKSTLDAVVRSWNLFREEKTIKKFRILSNNQKPIQGLDVTLI